MCVHVCVYVCVRVCVRIRCVSCSTCAGCDHAVFALQLRDDEAQQRRLARTSATRQKHVLALHNCINSLPLLAVQRQRRRLLRCRRPLQPLGRRPDLPTRPPRVLHVGLLQPLLPRGERVHAGVQEQPAGRLRLHAPARILVRRGPRPVRALNRRMRCRSFTPSAMCCTTAHAVWRWTRSRSMSASSNKGVTA